jgi:hypothetical protein
VVVLDQLPKDQESVGFLFTLAQPDQPKVRRALSRTRRELTEEEFAAPVVLQMLLDDVDRLESEKAEIVQFRSRFHEADTIGKTKTRLPIRQPTIVEAQDVPTI